MNVFDVDLDFFFNKRIGPEADLSIERRLRWNRQIDQWLSLDEFINRFRPAFHTDIEFHGLESHQDVLELWASKIKSGHLSIPFTVIHFDAHSDLYVGRRQDDYFEVLTPEEVLNNPSLFNTVAEEDNFLWWMIKFKWVKKIFWVKPPFQETYFLDKKEFSTDFQTQINRPEILKIKDQLNQMLNMEKVDHPALLTSELKKTYCELETQLRYLSYSRPFGCTRFNLKWTFGLFQMSQISLSKKSVRLFSLAHSKRYVPGKADKVFAEFKNRWVR